MDRSGYRPCSLLDAPQQAEAEPLAAPGEVWEEFREFTGLIVPEGIPKGGDDGAPPEGCFSVFRDGALGLRIRGLPSSTPAS